jgi:hypothetical protein
MVDDASIIKFFLNVMQTSYHRIQLIKQVTSFVSVSFREFIAHDAGIILYSLLHQRETKTFFIKKFPPIKWLKRFFPKQTKLSWVVLIKSEDDKHSATFLSHSLSKLLLLFVEGYCWLMLLSAVSFSHLIYEPAPLLPSYFIPFIPSKKKDVHKKIISHHAIRLRSEISPWWMN